MGGFGQLPTRVLAKLAVAVVAVALIAPCFAGCRRSASLPPPPVTAAASVNAKAEILGISVLEVSSNSITITKATTGTGSNMMVLVRGREVNKTTLSVGDTFLVSDGRHASQSYRLIGIEQVRAVFSVTERFNSASFGDGNRGTRHTLRFASYSLQ